MSIEQIIALVGIGGAVGALTYYAFFRLAKTASREERSSIEIPVPTFPSISGKETVKKEAPKAKIGSPLKAACTQCKKVATLPFRCRFCTELFCGEHRLPENHNCEAL